MDNKLQALAVVLCSLAFVGIASAGTYKIDVTTSAEADSAIATAAADAKVAPENIIANDISGYIEAKYTAPKLEASRKAFIESLRGLYETGSIAQLEAATACINAAWGAKP